MQAVDQVRQLAFALGGQQRGAAAARIVVKSSLNVAEHDPLRIHQPADHVFPGPPRRVDYNQIAPAAERVEGERHAGCLRFVGSSGCTISQITTAHNTSSSPKLILRRYASACGVHNEA